MINFPIDAPHERGAGRAATPPAEGYKYFLFFLKYSGVGVDKMTILYIMEL